MDAKGDSAKETPSGEKEEGKSFVDSFALCYATCVLPLFFCTLSSLFSKAGK